MADGADKRQSPRVSYPCEVDCAGVGGGHNPLSPRISDLSVTGAFVDAVVTVPQGTQVRLTFTLPSGPVSCLGEVAHEMPQFGMGVRFLDLTPEQRAAIQSVVQSAL